MNWKNEETVLVNDWYYDHFNELCEVAYDELETQPTASEFELYVWKDLRMDSMPIGLTYSVLNKTLARVDWQQLVDYHRVVEDNVEQIGGEICSANGLKKIRID